MCMSIALVFFEEKTRQRVSRSASLPHCSTCVPSEFRKTSTVFRRTSTAFRSGSIRVLRRFRCFPLRFRNHSTLFHPYSMRVTEFASKSTSTVTPSTSHSGTWLRPRTTHLTSPISKYSTSPINAAFLTVPEIGHGLTVIVERQSRSPREGMFTVQAIESFFCRRAWCFYQAQSEVKSKRPIKPTRQPGQIVRAGACGGRISKCRHKGRCSAARLRIEPPNKCVFGVRFEDAVRHGEKLCADRLVPESKFKFLQLFKCRDHL